MAVVNNHTIKLLLGSAGQFCNYLPWEANSKFTLSFVNLNLGTRQDCKLTQWLPLPSHSTPRDGTEIDRSVKTVKPLRICVCACVHVC